jgi:hypothetical protein
MPKPVEVTTAKILDYCGIRQFSEMFYSTAPELVFSKLPTVLFLGKWASSAKNYYEIRQ